MHLVNRGRWLILYEDSFAEPTSPGGLVHLVNGCRGDAEFGGNRIGRMLGDIEVYPTIGSEPWKRRQDSIDISCCQSSPDL